MATDPVFAAVEQKAREIVNDPYVTDAQAAQWMAGVIWALAAVRWRQEIRVIDRLPIAAPDPAPPALDAERLARAALAVVEAWDGNYEPGLRTIDMEATVSDLRAALASAPAPAPALDAERLDRAMCDHQHDPGAPLAIRRDHLARLTFRSCAAAIAAEYGKEPTDG